MGIYIFSLTTVCVYISVCCHIIYRGKHIERYVEIRFCFSKKKKRKSFYRLFVITHRIYRKCIPLRIHYWNVIFVSFSFWVKNVSLVTEPLLYYICAEYPSLLHISQNDFSLYSIFFVYLYIYSQLLWIHRREYMVSG